jgi:glutamate-1-semialdehyde 2,1-aminomutase
MASLAPLGPVYQAGTLSGNPLATAAGLAVLELLTDDLYARIESTAATLADGLDAALRKAGVPGRAPRVGTLLGLTLADEGVDAVAYGRFFHELLRRGVALAPGAYEVLFPGAAHTDDVVDEVIDAATEAASAL